MDFTDALLFDFFCAFWSFDSSNFEQSDQWSDPGVESDHASVYTNAIPEQTLYLLIFLKKVLKNVQKHLGSTFILGWATPIKAINKYIGAEQIGDYGTTVSKICKRMFWRKTFEFFVECANIAKLPLVSIVIGGQEYSLRGEDYILDADDTFRTVKDGKRMCISGFAIGITLCV